MCKWITISYSWKYIVVLIAGQIVICGLIGTSLGWFWHHEWVRPCKKVSECAHWLPIDNGIVPKSDSLVKIYNGKWQKDYLEIMK